MRLLPWLGTCFSMARSSVTDDTSLQLIQVTTSVIMLKNTECHIKKAIKMNSNITPWKKAIKMSNQFQIFSSVIAIWCCGYCTVSFVIVRIQWKRTEGSGSSLSPMITRYRRWTLSCAPLACSWTLSEQSESKWYKKVKFPCMAKRPQIRRFIQWLLAHFVFLYILPPELLVLRHET